MRAFGCGEFGDVPAAQYLGVVRRDPQSRRIPPASVPPVAFSAAMRARRGRCPRCGMRVSTVPPNQFSNARSYRGMSSGLRHRVARPAQYTCPGSPRST